MITRAGNVDRLLLSSLSRRFPETDFSVGRCQQSKKRGMSDSRIKEYLVVSIYIAVLAESLRVQFIMAAKPGLFVSSLFVVAVGAHALGVMLPLRMAACVKPLANYKMICKLRN